MTVRQVLARVVLLSLLVVSCLGCSPAPRGARPDDGLWFGTARGPTLGKMYFAHYLTAYPRSLDNRQPDYYTTQYLDVDGERGIHRAYGGFWRDRPLERAPLTGDYRLQDAMWEVQAARRAGIDGFFVDIFSLAPAAGRVYRTLVQATDELGVDFKIVPMIDANGDAAATASPAEWARALAVFLGHPSTYLLPDGRFLVGSFYADKFSTGWWQDRLRAVSATHRVEVAFYAGLLDLSTVERFLGVAAYVGPWSYGADPRRIATFPDTAYRLARSRGVGWVAAVMAQSVRPSQGTFDEAGNSAALRASWARAVREQADLVQAVTWNDYAEGSAMAPSVGHSWALASVSAYYAQEWRTGQRPPVLADAVILSHRDQPLVPAGFGSGQTRLMRQVIDRGPAQFSPPREDVEVLTYLTAPASVTVRVGRSTHTYEAPAGESVRTVPLELGVVAVSAARSGTSLVSLTSPFVVTDRPVSQDRQYFFLTSLEGTGGQHPMMTR